MKSDHSPECYKCADRMTDADIEEEAPMQDSLCIECRKSREASIEEEAVASFCQYHSKPVSDWHMDVLTKCGFTFDSRKPADTNQTCMELVYHCGSAFKLSFTCINGNWIIFEKSNQYTPSEPDWKIIFGLSTPPALILATIKAAVEHEAA